MSGLTINIREWDELLPVKGSSLYQYFLEDEASRQIVSVLNEKGILNIIELKEGIKISSNSYVGKIKIGDIQINIRPKIEGMPLYKLLKYAYGLRDLNIFDEAIYDVDSFPFQDLLIYQLYAEAEDLIYRGLNKKYVRQEEDLGTPKGRINIGKLATRNHIPSATLPCSYYDRSEDNLFNRVLLAGLQLAIYLTEDLSLRIQLSRLCKTLEDNVKQIDLNRGILLKTLKSVDRLSDRYNSALELINILYESQGIQLEDGRAYMKLNGFFFDMNMFFQSLLSKLMGEYLLGFTIRDEFTLQEMFAYTPGFNPQRRYAPKPRPDFAVMNGVKVIRLLDAKYRDLWETKLPREMLYQLSIYAVSGIGNSTAKIIYPSMTSGAKLQKININNPATGDKLAEVMLQPLHMVELAQMMGLRKNDKTKLQEYITQIVFSN
ncbi:5-methylcytosine-specific restriction enzyme subunit McrC [Natranaerovirga pectinivora]|uniref:5-methylcytosine-specific restriction enzyme subunit McrC n=1 Tax=Natranaerovirga pectinivora TaxID=682400 RepID=A0A4R3MP02_9FIRM|nr:restriction endonuclease [Natranaerovirga pectinivora]TCT14544.1 5-methylcytosine-specific restriction enzyme subunit McrC [Natranaerovirga pectinivora]